MSRLVTLFVKTTDVTEVSNWSDKILEHSLEHSSTKKRKNITHKHFQSLWSVGLGTKKKHQNCCRSKQRSRGIMYHLLHKCSVSFCVDPIRVFFYSFFAEGQCLSCYFPFFSPWRRKQHVWRKWGNYVFTIIPHARVQKEENKRERGVCVCVCGGAGVCTCSPCEKHIYIIRSHLKRKLFPTLQLLHIVFVC